VACFSKLPEIPPGKKFTILLVERGGEGSATIFPVATVVKYRSWDSWHVYTVVTQGHMEAG
jgi:hypothetical protein